MADARLARPVPNQTRFVVRRGVHVAHLRFTEDRAGLLLDCGNGPERWNRARIQPRWFSKLRIEADGRPALTVTVCGQLDPEWTMRAGTLTLLWEGGSYFSPDLSATGLAPARPHWARRLRARRDERRRLLLAAATALPANSSLISSDR